MNQDVQYSVTQLDYPYGELICTSCCVIYAYFCSKQKPSIHETDVIEEACHETDVIEEACHETDVIEQACPSEEMMDKIFQMASMLHTSTLEGCEMEYNSILSVHDIIRTTTKNDINKSLFEMVEIQGSFNEDILEIFKNDIDISKLANEKHTNTLLDEGEDCSVYSIKEAFETFLHKGVSAILTIEDCRHTIAIHKRTDGKCTLFDPLPGRIQIFDSTEAITRYLQEKQFQSQFSCYFS
jgi:hypothetical protein